MSTTSYTASSVSEAKNVMQHQLSSPLSSYEFDCTLPNLLYVRHHQTYAEMLKVCSAGVPDNIF